MGLFRFQSTKPNSADQSTALLGKILQRLNDSASAEPTEPASNVSISNTPLACEIVNVPTEIDVGNWPATQNVAVTNIPHVEVDNFPATQPVSGTVAVSNFPASQNVAVTNAPNVAVNNFPATQDVQVVDPDTGDHMHIVDGHIDTMSVPVGFEINESGFYQSRIAKNYAILGRRAGFNSTSVLQDVGEWLGTSIDHFPVLTGLEDLELVSSSADDDNSPGGVGTRSVSIVYLDTSYAIQRVTYTMNGLTPTAVTEKMLFVYWMEALTGGANEVGSGNIDLRIAGGGAIHERISAGSNRSLSARFMVPDGYTAYITHWSCESVGTTQDVRLRATVDSYTHTTGTRYLFKATCYLGNGGESDHDLPYIFLPARAKVKVSTLPGAAPVGNRVGASFDVWLIEDEV